MRRKTAGYLLSGIIGGTAGIVNAIYPWTTLITLGLAAVVGFAYLLMQTIYGED